MQNINVDNITIHNLFRVCTTNYNDWKHNLYSKQHWYIKNLASFKFCSQELAKLRAREPG